MTSPVLDAEWRAQIEQRITALERGTVVMSEIMDRHGTDIVEAKEWLMQQRETLREMRAHLEGKE